MNVANESALAPNLAVVDGALYSPGQVGLATLLGSPIAGAWLLAANCGVLGEGDARRRTITYGAIGTAVGLVLAFALPEHFPAFVLPAAYTVTIREFAKRVQGDRFNVHVQNGGRKQSTWRAAGIGVAWLAAVLSVVLVVLLMSVGQDVGIGK